MLRLSRRSGRQPETGTRDGHDHHQGAQCTTGDRRARDCDQAVATLTPTDTSASASSSLSLFRAVTDHFQILGATAGRGARDEKIADHLLRHARTLPGVPQEVIRNLLVAGAPACRCTQYLEMIGNGAE